MGERVMLTEKSTYDEMRRVMFGIVRKFSRRPPTVIPGLRGKVERARFRGERSVVHDMVVDGQPVRIGYEVSTKLWGLYAAVRGSRVTMLTTATTHTGDLMLEVVTPHALERYVQRYVKHDERAVVTLEEMEAAGWHYLLDKDNAATVVYDETSGCHFRNFDGGAFLVVVDDERGLVINKTYLTVSKMRINQSVANGVATRESKSLNRRYTDLERKRRAEAATMKLIK